MAINKKKNKCGSISYTVRVRDRHGRWFPTKTFSRKTDADQHERSLLSQKDVGQTAFCSMRREIALVDYIQTMWKVDCRNRVSDGWKISQDQMLRDYIIPVIGQFKIGEVQSSDIGCALRGMEARGLGAQMRRHAYNMLHHIFDAACSYHQVIGWNPVSKRDRPEVPVVERTVLKPEQVTLLLNTARHHPCGVAIWLGALAALRTNEIQALKWSAIDFESNIIHIRAGFKRKTGVLEPYPKQRKHGSVPMMPVLRDYLLEKARGTRSEDFVVAGYNTPMLSHGYFLRVLKAICRDLAIPIITPHGLRHSCTEIWCEHGASEEDIVRLLNQSGSGSVRRYIHKSPERLQRIAANISLPICQQTAPKKLLHLVK